MEFTGKEGYALASLEPSPVTPAQSRPIRLLVVEDHRDTARMLWLLLAGSSYEVKSAGDAATALDLAAQESFDLLISDIGLPDQTGYDLMKAIRERYRIKGDRSDRLRNAGGHSQES